MINPLNAVRFFLERAACARFLALGSVVLAVTGAEALYADMGHFGRRPIKRLLAVFRASRAAAQLHGAGRDAPVAAAPHEALTTVKDPFFYLAPDMLRLPLVLLATAATIIASQAVISGAFSVTQQAIQLGFVPRLRIAHTSESAAGQIYIPVVNWALMIDGPPAGADLPHLVQPRRRLRHRGDRRDADRHRAHRRRADQHVEVEPLSSSPALLVALLRRSTSAISART